MRLWVSRRKEPILGYVTKNDEKNNLGGLRLKTVPSIGKHITISYYLFKDSTFHGGQRGRKVLRRQGKGALGPFSGGGIVVVVAEGPAAPHVRVELLAHLAQDVRAPCNQSVFCFDI